MLRSRAAAYCRWLLLDRQLREDGMCDVIVWFVVELASTGVPKNVDTFHVTTQKLQDAAAHDRTGGSDYCQLGHIEGANQIWRQP